MSSPPIPRHIRYFVKDARYLGPRIQREGHGSGEEVGTRHAADSCYKRLFHCGWVFVQADFLQLIKTFLYGGVVFD